MAKIAGQNLVGLFVRDLEVTTHGFHQTNQILARNLRQLRHLEDEKLVEQIKNIEKEKASYEVRLKRPSAYIAKHLDELQSKIK
jgi:DNA gyrase/topoisomerase IV subunit A